MNESDNPGIQIVSGPKLAALYRAATRVDAGKSAKLSFTVDGGVEISVPVVAFVEGNVCWAIYGVDDIFYYYPDLSQGIMYPAS